VWRALNRWGFPADVVRDLVRPEILGDGVEEALEGIRDDYQKIGPPGARRMWRYMLHGRGRIHVGGPAWRQSFFSWPILPAADGAVLSFAGNLPYMSQAGRVLQKAVIEEKFPRLAMIPMMGNSGSMTMLRPRITELTMHRIRSKLGDRMPFRREDRYFIRSGSVETERWKSLRHEADRRRDSTGHVLNRAALDRHLPPAETSTGGRGDLFADPARIKLLVGLVLWASEL
jgi:hypothetical protein